jgi:FkbM family methyltransferase
MMTALSKFADYLAFVEGTGGLNGSAAVMRRFLGRINSRFVSSSDYSLRVRGFTSPVHIRLPTSDWTVFFKVFIAQEYQEISTPHAAALKSLYEDVLRQGKSPVIIDCGANIGLSSLWYAKRFPQAKVVAIEPEADNFALLVKNCSHHNRIMPICAGISDNPTKFQLSNPSGEPWAWETRQDSDGAVEGVTIGDVLKTIDNAVPFIVKIDIEGFETELFRSNMDWISQVPLIVIETHDWLFAWKGSAHAAFSAITKAGPRDYLQNGENTFCYSHELLRNYREGHR